MGRGGDEQARAGRRSLWVATLLGLFCLGMTSCGHVGQRLLQIEIELDGQLALQGIRGVRDDMPVPRMWDELRDVGFEIDPAMVDSLGAADAQTLELEGKVVVRISHVDRELTTASLPSLLLDRIEAEAPWTLSAGELERLKAGAAP